jgi:hypothetical protein
MANRTLAALAAAQDAADQEADLWRARQYREATDGQNDLAMKHALRAAWCLDASAAIAELRSALKEGQADE